MGTLGNQEPRSTDGYNTEGYNIEIDIESIQRLCTKYKLPFTTILQLIEVLEKRRENNIRIMSGDYHDEHLGGFGDILRELPDMIAESVGSFLDRKENEHVGDFPDNLRDKLPWE